MRYLPILLFCATAARASDCIPVEGRIVRAADVAVRLPAFAVLPADTFLGYAPAPGNRRLWSASQLSAILNRHGIQTPPSTNPGDSGVCVDRPSRTYTLPEVERALREALPPGAQLRVVDFCRLAMPVGVLEFDRKGLPAPGSSTAAQTNFLWRGHVRYEPHRSTPFWATVSIAVPQAGLFAAGDLAAGHTITAQDFVYETRLMAPAQPPPESDPALLIGSRCRRAIPVGAPITRQQLALPPEIVRGDTVEVVVESGLTRVTFPALATAAGRAGETILVENTATGKHLKARIDGPGRATAIATDSHANKTSPGAGLRAGNPRQPLAVRGSKAQTEGTQPAGSLPPGR